MQSRRTVGCSHHPPTIAGTQLDSVSEAYSSQVPMCIGGQAGETVASARTEEHGLMINGLGPIYFL